MGASASTVKHEGKLVIANGKPEISMTSKSFKFVPRNIQKPTVSTLNSGLQVIQPAWCVSMYHNLH